MARFRTQQGYDSAHFVISQIKNTASFWVMKGYSILFEITFYNFETSGIFILLDDDNSRIIPF